MEPTGIAAGSWRRAWPTGGRKRTAVVAVALLVAAGAVVAVSDSGPLTSTAADEAVGAPGSAGSDNAVGGQAVVIDQTADAASGQTSSGASPTAIVDRAAPPAGVAGVVGSGSRIIKHAELSIEVADGSITDAFDRVATIASGRGGFVVSSSTSSFDAGGGNAKLTLRVPAEQFEATRADLARVGQLHSVQVRGEDVSAQLVDLDARLRALRAEESALTALLGEAGNVGEVLAVREQVSATRLEIEQLAAQQASLDDRASFSTLAVALSEPGAFAAGPEPEPATGLVRSFERALDASVAVAGGMVVVLGYLLPLAVVGLFAWGATRLARIRRRPA